jgi:hypothetical protein
MAMGLKKSLGFRMVPAVLDAIAGRCKAPVLPVKRSVWKSG